MCGPQSIHKYVWTPEPLNMHSNTNSPREFHYSPTQLTLPPTARIFVGWKDPEPSQFLISKHELTLIGG